MTALLVLAGIVFLAWTTQAMTGFGATVIALTLGAHLVPITELLPVLVALNVPLCIYVCWRDWAHTDRSLLLGGILPFMSAGVVLGLIAAPWLDGPTLKRGFGVLVVAVAVRALFRMARSVPTRAPGAWSARGLLLASGVTHGLWGSGGPLLVVALAGVDRDRRVFRATLMAVWLVFNGVLLAAFAARGAFDGEAWVRIAALLPMVPLGIALGERLHHRVPEAAFHGVVQAVLLFAGAALIR